MIKNEWHGTCDLVLKEKSFERDGCSSWFVQIHPIEEGTCETARHRDGIAAASN
jgi:hypothetical protein